MGSFRVGAKVDQKSVDNLNEHHEHFGHDQQIRF